MKQGVGADMLCVCDASMRDPTLDTMWMNCLLVEATWLDTQPCKCCRNGVDFHLSDRRTTLFIMEHVVCSVHRQRKGLVQRRRSKLSQELQEPTCKGIRRGRLTHAKAQRERDGCTQPDRIVIKTPGQHDNDAEASHSRGIRRSYGTLVSSLTTKVTSCRRS